MIKGLGHLIRIVFGGREPAPALPSHTTGDVGAGVAVPPPASDDVLRRAMEAAGEAEAEGAGLAGAGPRYEPPRIEEVGSLPTLFLHGKPSEPLALDQPPEESAVVGLEPELQGAEAPGLSAAGDVAELVPIEGVAEPRDRLLAVMAFEEIEHAPRASELILFGREFSTHAGRVTRLAAPHDAPMAAAGDMAEPVMPPAEEACAGPSLAEEAPRKPARRKAEPGTNTRRKKSAKALPEDAVWLTDAVIWTQCGSWREFWLPPTDPESSARVEEFRVLAAEGHLTIWGRTGEALEWTPITAAHWKKAGFDPLAFLAGRESAFSQAPVKKSRTKPPADPVRYSSLMVSKSAVEAIWAARSASDAAVA